MDDATEAKRLRLEVKFWKKWAVQNGRAAWEETKENIKKKRGAKGLAYLLDAMNKDI